MSEVERLADQLQRVYAGEAWHGPALADLLEGVDATGAAARPLPGRHSIWELVLHMTTWHEAVRQRLQGEAPAVSDEQDWPRPGEPSEAAWRAAREALAASHARLREAVLALAEGRLEEKVHGGASAYQTVLGVIQHDAYHGGQVALLRGAAGRPS